jgi:D-3-phosphoglycerate dehydrogenase / 2-oxoglutarate reductase
MARFKAVFVEHDYVSVEPDRSIIEAAEGEFVDADRFPLEEAWAMCADADAVMVRRLPVTREMISRLRQCQVLVRYGIGVDIIDLQAATEQGIIVSHVPTYCQDEVSTQAIGLMLACVRRLVSTIDQVREGGWDVHASDPVYRLAGKTVGLIGFGTLGQAVARKLQGWDLHLCATDPYVDADVAQRLNVNLVPLETLLRSSDIVSLHAPLLPETTHLMDDAAFESMKPNAVLVNTARGAIVDEAALLRALERRQLNCAGLDVFETEPLSAGSPLRNHPRIVATDHMAWYSEESRLDLQKSAAQEVARVCGRKLPEAIANPEVLEKLGRAAEWVPNHVARWQARRLEAIHKAGHRAGA